MDAIDKDSIARLEAMTINQARKEIASGNFGVIKSPHHRFASDWLSAKEAEARDERDAITLSISRKALRNSNWANIIAISATIIAIMAIIIAWLTKN